MIRRARYFILICLTCWGCSREYDARLERINQLCETSAEEALSCLDSLDCSSLSERDRWFYDFLRIKVADKAYIKHTTDSSYLRVLDHFRDDSRFGGEVLYYGGRVYSDMGDYPTALAYFREGIEATPSESNLHLRGNLLSQTARLNSKLKLYSEAIPYLKESLLLDSIENNTYNIVYDLKLLGSAYLNRDQLDSAEIVLMKAYKMSELLTDEDKRVIEVNIADLEHKKGNISRSLEIIRGLPEKIKPSKRNLALINATEIYYAAGIMDTAFYYADALVRSKYDTNKHLAFPYILSPELIRFIPKDSVPLYQSYYNFILNERLQQNESEAALIQNAYYNYDHQQNLRIAAESERNHILIYLLVAVGVILCLIIALLLFVIRNQRNALKLRQAIKKISILQRKLIQENGVQIQKEPDSEPDIVINDELRMSIQEEYRKYLLELARSGSTQIINPAVNESEVVARLKALADEGKNIAVDDRLWTEIEELILSHHPQLFEHLELLFDGPIKPRELHIILLIKCGMTPKQIAVLLNRTKGAISDRRARLGSRLLQESITSQEFDNIIRVL